MGTTTTYGIAYPEGSDQPQAHLDIKSVADDVDTLLAAARAQRVAYATSALSVVGTNNSDLHATFNFTKPASWAAFVVVVTGSVSYTMSAAAGVKYNVRFYDGSAWRTIAGQDGMATAHTLNQSFAYTSNSMAASLSNLRLNFEVLGAGTGTTYASAVQYLFMPIVP